MTGTTPRIAALTALTVLAFTGCQSIPERPIDLGQAAEALVQRGVDLEPVAAYAAALAASRDETPADFDPSDGLTLAEAETVASLYNAEVRIARVRAEGAAAIAASSGRWDDPGAELSGGQKRVESESGVAATLTRDWTFSPDGVSRGTSYTFERARESIDRNWIASGSLSITIPLSGRLGAERRARSAEHGAALLAVDEAEWNARIALRQAWRRWSAASAAVELLDGHLAALGAFGESAEAMAAAGEIEPGASRLFAVERGRARAERLQAIENEAAQRIAVLHLMGLAPGAPVRLTPSLEPGEALQPDAAIAARVAVAHPGIARLRAEYAAAEARLRVELRKQYPDITLSPAATDERDETALLLGLGMPIPVWNANRAGIAEAAAARDFERIRVETAYESVVAEYGQMERRHAGARARRASLSGEAGPEADRQLEEAVALLRLGEIDVIPLYEALAQSLAVKQDLLDAQTEEAIAHAALAALPRPTENPATEPAP